MQALDWPDMTGATGFDVVRGDLSTLRSAGLGGSVTMGSPPNHELEFTMFLGYFTTYPNVKVKIPRSFELKCISFNHNETER